MEEDRLYQVTLRNIPFLQAQALYRFMLNMADYEVFHGSPGMSWSGLIAGKSPADQPLRTVTLNPMPTHEEIVRERELRRFAEWAAALYHPSYYDLHGIVTEVKRRADDALRVERKLQ